MRVQKEIKGVNHEENLDKRLFFMRQQKWKSFMYKMALIKNYFGVGNPDNKIGLLLPYLSMILFVILLSVLSFKRQALNYGAESGFTGIFVLEAQHFLNGDHLEILFHPPFYSIILATIY